VGSLNFITQNDKMTKWKQYRSDSLK